MILYHSGVRQNATNATYPYAVEIKSCEDLVKVVSYDNTCAKCKDNYRKNDNFLGADCSMFDVDNTHSDNPAEWIYPENVRTMFPDVAYYAVYSRNHMKEKNGKAARPKFHIYFADKVFTSMEEYTKHKQAVCNYFTAFDPNAKDAARFFFGVENPQVEYFDGSVLLSDFMETVTMTADNLSETPSPQKSNNAECSKSLSIDSVIPEGCRNSTLISYAACVLKRHGDVSETAYKLYIERSECCSPRLDYDEVQRIWKSALKFYREKIKTACDYVEPELFSRTDNLIESLEDFVLDVKNRQAITSLLAQNHSNKAADIKATRLFLHSFGITIRHNNMTHRTEIAGLPDFYQGEEELKSLGTIAKDTLAKLKFKSLGNISNNLDLITLENRYHPVLDVLHSAEWDGKDRLSEIYDILGISDDLSKSLVRKWAIQSIALLYNDESAPISAQGVLVLQGKQGIGKTEFFKHLAIENRFFKEGAVLDMANKDTIISATSVWLCELGELDSTTAKKQSALKSFLTANTDRYREPYGRKDVVRVRRTAFCGTVNPVGFLSDETGNRRYWTIHVEKIDLEKVFGYSPEWYTQFWRQILCEYIENPKAYLLSRQENEQLNKRNEDYEENIYGEDEFLATFDITAPTDKWVYRTAAEIVEILNVKYKKLNLSSSAFGKTLVPKLERRFNVEFKKKIISGKQLRLCPPAFFDTSYDDDFADSYRIEAPKISYYDDILDDQDDSDVIF